MGKSEVSRTLHDVIPALASQTEGGRSMAKGKFHTMRSRCGFLPFGWLAKPSSDAPRRSGRGVLSREAVKDIGSAAPAFRGGSRRPSRMMNDHPLTSFHNESLI